MKDRLLTIALSVAATYGILKVEPDRPRELEVDRLVVRRELIVSDTGSAWEAGYEAHQIPRGLYARSLADGPGGLWVRSRLIKAEVDDPFDDRFHAIERDGTLRRAPGHISWNVWLDGAWRQMAIIQGEGLELSEVPREQWNGSTHPGRLRIQTFRPRHGEPLTDALIGQGMMSLGGGGYGGGGLPYPSETLQLWGGEIEQSATPRSAAPKVTSDDGSGAHRYAIVAVGAQGRRTAASPDAVAKGLRSSSGTAWPARTPTSSFATARRSPGRYAWKAHAKHGAISRPVDAVAAQRFRPRGCCRRDVRSTPRHPARQKTAGRFHIATVVVAEPLDKLLLLLRRPQHKQGETHEPAQPDEPVGSQQRDGRDQ